MRIPDDLKKILRAADGADWMQVALVHSYGPPCFHLMPEGRFCLRASSWFGHGTANDDVHPFLSLGSMIDQQLANARKEALEEAARRLDEIHKLPNYIQTAGYFAKEIRALIAKEPQP